MSPSSESQQVEVRAAGGVVVRRKSGEVQVLLVHRPRYDDWSFPKGKVEPDERWRDAAVREVLEETGLVCERGKRLPPIQYRDRRLRLKEVRYWEMTATGGKFVVNDEVDEIAWLPVERAAKRLSYARDRAVLASLIERMLIATAKR